MFARVASPGTLTRDALLRFAFEGSRVLLLQSSNAGVAANAPQKCVLSMLFRVMPRGLGILSVLELLAAHRAWLRGVALYRHSSPLRKVFRLLACTAARTFVAGVAAQVPIAG